MSNKKDQRHYVHYKNAMNTAIHFCRRDRTVKTICNFHCSTGRTKTDYSRQHNNCEKQINMNLVL
jgi:hypothetical protein